MRHIGLLTFIGFDGVTWRYKTVERDLRKDVLKIQVEASDEATLRETALEVMSAVTADKVSYRLATEDVHGMLDRLTRDIPNSNSIGIGLEGENVSVNWRYTVVDDRVCDVIIIK